MYSWECSGSVVECLTWDWRAAGSSLTGVTVLCPWARHINPSLVLVQSRKTRPYITERLLMGRKESNNMYSILSSLICVHFHLHTSLNYSVILAKIASAINIFSCIYGWHLKCKILHRVLNLDIIVGVLILVMLNNFMYLGLQLRVGNRKI